MARPAADEATRRTREKTFGTQGSPYSDPREKLRRSWLLPKAEVFSACDREKQPSRLRVRRERVKPNVF